jgi:prepilin-type N-terminal cleavage/methylation domain-containing protein
MRPSPTRDGFTLIELLIVIVIIAALAVIAFSPFWSVRARGHQTAMQADLKTAATQQELYYSVHDRYALSTEELTEFNPSPGVIFTITFSANDGWAGVTTHTSLVSAQCGFATSRAPLLLASPTTVAGVVACTDLD